MTRNSAISAEEFEKRINGGDKANGEGWKVNGDAWKVNGQAVKASGGRGRN